MSQRTDFRSNSNRARSQSRGRGGFRGRGALGFFSQRTQDEEAQKLQKTKEDVQDLHKFVESKKVEQTLPSQQQKESKRHDKINKTVEAGKEFVSKFFKGFTQPERGNIKVTLDSSLPGRMVAPYTEKIKSYTETKFQLKPDDKFKKYFNQFRGITEIGIAIKLQKSATEFQRNLNYKFSSIRNLDIPLPKKLNVLINQLGKTDLTNDNRIRLKHQHLLVKRFMLRGAAYFLQDDLDQYLNNNNTGKIVRDYFDRQDLFDKVLDNTIGSISLLKTIGKQYFEETTNGNYEFKMKGKTYTLRLPKFEFDEDKGIMVDDIVTYFKNDLFQDFQFDQDDIYKIIASLVFQVATFSWLKNRGKKIKELNKDFDGTIVANYTFESVLNYAHIGFIDTFIDDDVLDDVTNDVISKWKTASATHFNQMFNMEEVRFSDYGSDSQLVEIKEFQHKKNELDIPYRKIVNRSKAQTVLKTTEHGALLGLTLAIAKKVEFSSKFELQFDSKNDQILQEFIKTDFKT